MKTPDWLGLGERRWEKPPGIEVVPAETAWDWLQVAVVPVALVVIALAFNASQASRDERRQERQLREDRALAAAQRQEDRAAAEDRQQDDTPDRYLTQMSDLMLNHRLRPGLMPTRTTALARTVTLTALPRLDGRRKTEILQFLRIAGLITTDGLLGETVVHLNGADLRGVDVRDDTLVPMDLQGADLRGARFDGTVVEGVNFALADLREATFVGAIISSSDFAGARLEGARFDRAEFERQPYPREGLPLTTTFANACLSDVSFAGARLAGADLLYAEGAHTDFTNARLRGMRVGRDWRDEMLVEPTITGATGLPSGWPSRHNRSTSAKQRRMCELGAG